MTICCSSAGGTMHLSIDGNIVSVRGSVSIQPTAFEVEAGANLDSTVYTTRKPVPVNISMTLSDRCGLELEEVVSWQCVDGSVELDSVGRTYALSQMNVIGRPQLDPETGEISGLELVAQSIKQINFDI